MQESPHKTISGFLRTRRVSKVYKEGNYQGRILYVAKLSFKDEDYIKTFPEKQSLKEIITTRPALQEMLREV